MSSANACPADAGPLSSAPATRGTTEQRSRAVAIGMMCAALVCFAGVDASAKWLNQFQDPLLTTWARYFASVALISVVLNPVSVPNLARTRRPWLQAARSLILVVSTTVNFFALQYLQLTETISIQFATPLLVALLAGPLLGEWVGPRRLAAIGVGFIGVLIVTRPGFGDMHPAALLSVVSAILYALYNIATRMLAGQDSSATTMFYSGLAGVIVLTPILPYVWTTPSSPLVWFMMLALGAFGAIGHWLLILAHARAPAGILAPFIYTQLLWMVALGYFLFGDLPDRWTIVGAAVVVGSGLYLLYRERVRKVETKVII